VKSDGKLYLNTQS